jgi:hypothetical protein
MGFGALQLSLVAMGDRDPLEWRQSYSLSSKSQRRVKILGQASRTPALLLDVSRSELESGALQLSLVAMGDRDPLEWRQSFSASSLVPSPPKIFAMQLVL